MRRLAVAVFGLATLLATFVLAPMVAPAAGADQDAARGLAFQGLVRDQGACQSAFRLANARSDTRCTHGPDTAPDGVDVRQRRAPDPWAAAGLRTPFSGTAADTGTLQCYGTGSDGFRIQAIYVHATNATDRLSQYKASFVQWAAAADSVFNASAAETGGARHLRFVTDSSCAPVIDDVTVSTAAG
ncbi:MAG: hypothetical protein JO176_00040, partial [Acidimicrobiia bacterium]|nr:hypothetical protein [Acidimicrobiia bacterium]